MNHNRVFWEFLTNSEIFDKYIFPSIKNNLYDYVFVDFYAWEWNLILPILKNIPLEKRNIYFKNHIFLFDIQKDLVDKSIKNAINLWVNENIAKTNIKLNDSLKEYPKINNKFPIFHITNPPYLYIWHMKKNEKIKHYLNYFNWEKDWLQDLYQLAMYNDLQNNIEKNIYIIPTNFLFSNSWTNKIRKIYLKNYKIEKAILFEERIFDFTWQNVWIFFFNKKEKSIDEIQKFDAIKINWKIKNRSYVLKPEYNYRWSTEFLDYCKQNYNSKIKVSFYLMEEELLNNKWNKKILAYDINNKAKKEYLINNNLYRKIKENFLYIRTIDTGKKDWRIWLYDIREDFWTDCIVITNWKTYRTYPIQIFLENNIELYKLKHYFNNTLEYFREKYDSDFLTTFMYSNSSEYIRKFIWLTYTKMLIQSFKL